MSSSYHATKDKGRVGAVDAVLTDDNGATGECLNATSLSVTVQTSDQFGGSVTTWREFVGGRGECSNCASVGVEAIPERTTRIVVKGQLSVGVSGMLFLTAVWENSQSWITGKDAGSSHQSYGWKTINSISHQGQAPTPTSKVDSTGILAMCIKLCILTNASPSILYLEGESS